MAINKEYNDVQLDVKFTEASTRANLVSEENISVSFGKLAKWYEALVPTGGSSGKILAWNSSGTAKWSDPLHPTITKSTDTTSTASPGHGGTFTVVDSVTREANGHVTKINTKTITLPADSNTDTKVTQNIVATTTDKNYPLLLSYYESLSSTTTAQTANRAVGIYANAKTSKITLTSGTADTSPGITATRTDTNASVSLMVGSGGTNHGVYSESMSKWLFVTNGTEAQTYNIVQNPSSTTTYAISFGGAGESGVGVPTNGTFTTGVKGHYINDGLGYRTREGVANGTEGLSALVLGNSLASSVAKNKTGYVRQYSTNEYYTDLKPNTLTASRTILLPDAAGTIAVFTATPTSGQVVVTDGTAGGIKSSGYTIAKSVPSDAKFSDTVTTVTTSGSGNAVTSITASNGALTVTKGSTFSLSTHTHNYAGSTSAGGPALSVSTAGGDVVLGTPSSSSDDSGDIVWKYGNGQEKARLYLSNTYTAKEGPLYRIFKSDGTGLYSGRLPLADGTSASGTWGISITGNAATSSNANAVNTSVTNGTTSSVSYGITFAADPNTSESNTMRKTNDFRISLKNGTAGTGGLAELVLGNNKNTSTADNKEGCISLYSSNTSYHTFKVASNTSAVTHTFPATTGTVLNSGTTSFTQTLSSGTKIGTIKINGTSTDLYCQTNTNTDTKVKVTTSTSKAYLIGTTTSPDGTAVEGVGNTGVYMTNGVLTAAFAGALSGNATTSSSWATARTLTLGGQLTGSVSVKGDANMTLNGYMDRAFIYDDQAVSDDHTWAEYAWHKFAEVTIATTYTDCVITFLVSRTHGSSAENTGILSAKLRTNGSKAYDSAQLKWLVRNSGLSKDDFVMVYTSTSGTSTKAELWCRLPGQYAGLIFTVLKEHLRHYSTNTSWTLVKTPDGSGSTHGSSSYPTTGITGTIVSSDGTITNSTTGTATSANALNLIHGNELNFSKLASTGHIWLGYRWNTQGTETSGGTTITTYKFGNANGAGGLAGLEASTSTFKSGNFGDQLIVERTMAGSMASVTFKNPSGILGYISANTVDGDLYHYGATDTSTMKYVILDSHNYSSYALASTTKYAGSSSAGGAATNIATEVGSSAGARPVFYAYLGDNTRVVYNTNFTYNPSGNVLTATTFAGALSGNATSANKLNTNAGAKDRPVYFSGGVPVQCDAPWTSSWFKGVPLITTGGVMEIGKIINFHSTNTSTADYDLRLQYTGTATGKTVTLPGATGTVALLTKGSTSFWGLMDGDGSTSNWVRVTSNGLIPSAEAKFFQTATSSLGTDTWYFKKSYIQNMTANTLVLGAAKTTDGAAKGQVKFFSGNASDTTGTVTLECINDSARTGDYTVKLPTWNGTIPVFEKLFDGALGSVSLSYSDIDEYDLFLITVANSNATTEQVTVASLWISNIAGVHDMPLIWGGAPTSSGGSCNVTSGWIQLSKSSGTTTFNIGHKSNVAQMTSSGWSISSPTYNLYIRKIFGLKTYKRI